MDLFFANSDDVPLPPDQVDIRKLTADPLKDGKRVTVTFELTPFQQRPNIEILVTNQANKLVGSFSVVEAIDHKMSFTLHIREPKPQGTYQIDMQVFYTDIPPADDDSEELIKDILLENKKIVASKQHRFEIPA